MGVATAGVLGSSDGEDCAEMNDEAWRRRYARTLIEDRNHENLDERLAVANSCVASMIEIANEGCEARAIMNGEPAGTRKALKILNGGYPTRQTRGGELAGVGSGGLNTEVPACTDTGVGIASWT